MSSKFETCAIPGQEDLQDLRNLILFTAFNRSDPEEEIGDMRIADAYTASEGEVYPRFSFRIKPRNGTGEIAELSVFNHPDSATQVSLMDSGAVFCQKVENGYRLEASFMDDEQARSLYSRLEGVAGNKSAFVPIAPES